MGYTYIYIYIMIYCDILCIHYVYQFLSTALDFENMIMFEYVASIPGAFSKRKLFEQQVNAVDETFAGQMHQKRQNHRLPDVP